MNTKRIRETIDHLNELLLEVRRNCVRESRPFSNDEKQLIQQIQGHIENLRKEIEKGEQDGKRQ
jgi:hypothetical protein